MSSKNKKNKMQVTPDNKEVEETPKDKAVKETPKDKGLTIEMNVKAFQ